MATAQELLAKSLERLKKLHDSGQFVIASSDLPVVDRKRLVKASFLTQVMRGWYLRTRPDDRDGDTAPWQASWKEFVARYCESRFQSNWYLSPEQSIHVHVATPLPSRQIIVHALAGKNNSTALPHGWSIFDMKAAAFAVETARENSEGVRVLSLAYALTQVSEPFFRLQSATAQLALEMLEDTSDVALVLLADGKTVVAGRLVAALRAIGRHKEATDLLKTLVAAGLRIIETNPFDAPMRAINPAIKRSPTVMRIHQMWRSLRETIIEVFGDPPGMAANTSAYLADIDARYVADAYNSLSIEGYTVTLELIERVRSGAWNPLSEAERSRDALAARGYYLAHQEVIKTITRILAGEDAGTTLEKNFIDWNLALWTPSVQAGIVKAEQLAGYRNGPIYLRNANHVPPPREAVRDSMPTFFKLLGCYPARATRVQPGVRPTLQP